MKCPSCGAETVASAVYCPQCGHRLDEPAAGNPNDSPMETPAAKLSKAVRDRGDDDLEQTLWEGGYSGKAMVGTWVLLGLLTLVVPVVTAVFVSAETITLLTVAGVLLVLWLIAGLVFAVRKLGVRYQLTNQRFIHRMGILTQKTDRIEVIDIDDVAYTQGPVQRMLGVGTVRVVSSDRSHPELALHGIDQVQKVAGLIDDARRKERRRRGIHIETV